MPPQLLLTVLLVISLLPVPHLHAQRDAHPADEYIHSIYFGGGSYLIDDEQTRALAGFLEQVHRIEEYQIEIHGHTDNIGSLSYNQWLSEMRTLAVADLLKELGIPEGLINHIDFGEQAPVFDNDTWEGKIRNRRVDIILKRIKM